MCGERPTWPSSRARRDERAGEAEGRRELWRKSDALPEGNGCFDRLAAEVEELTICEVTCGLHAAFAVDTAIAHS
jgi:hypothetical protein